MCSRGHWRPSEDEKLKELVKKYGPHNWNVIAEKLQGRSGKSCRLRWFNQLDPKINRSPFSEEEEERLIASQQIHGNRWAVIARLFPGRTDNAVKNHWHVIMARSCRERSRYNHLKKNPTINNLFLTRDSNKELDGTKHHQEFFFQNKTCNSDVDRVDDGSVEFIDFLQVMKNPKPDDDDDDDDEKKGSCSRTCDQGGADEEDQKSENNWIPFIDFLAVEKCSSGGLCHD